MPFAILTDTSANLPSEWLEAHGIAVVPFSYIIDGQEHQCLDTRTFDGAAFYNAIRAGRKVTTSQITPQHYVDAFEPPLKDGQDVVMVSMSSGISGSCASAESAAEELRRRYPERCIRVVDTLGASLGEGIYVLLAEKYRAQGLSADETADRLLDRRHRMYQIFTVGDLMHLRRSGRLSDAKAIVGTLLGVKALLKGNSKGQIVAQGVARGRKAALRALAAKYDALCVSPETQTVGIAHADCAEDAETLAALLRKNRPPREILTVCYEPVTGSHVGPSTLALFFEGGDDVRRH